MPEKVNEKKEIKKPFKPQIAVVKKENQKEMLKRRKETWEKNNKDIFITKITNKTTEENGKIITERIKTKINLTRKINASAQMLKQKTAIEKLNEIKNMI